MKEKPHHTEDKDLFDQSYTDILGDDYAPTHQHHDDQHSQSYEEFIADVEKKREKEAFNVKKFFKIALPLALVGVALFAIVSKAIYSYQEGPLPAIKEKQIKPLLQTIAKKHNVLFKKHDQQLYRGNFRTNVYGDTLLSVEFLTDASAITPEASKRQQQTTMRHFMKLLCRSPEFLQLHTLQNRIKSDHAEHVDIAVEFVQVDLNTDDAVWKFSILPSQCSQ